MMSRLLFALLAACALIPAACADEALYPDAPPYLEDRDGAVVVEAALTRARAEDKHALFLFGADWCHDSRGFALKLETDPVLQALVEDQFVLERIDVGMRVRNQDQIQRFGLQESFGTPTVVIADGDGQSRNGLTAHDWRAVDNYSIADIALTLSRYAGAPAPEAEYAAVDAGVLLAGWAPYQALQAQLDEMDAVEARRVAEFARGLARSLVRYAMGEESKETGEALVLAEDLAAYGIAPVADRTEAVRERLDGFDFDLLDRLSYQDEETQEAAAEEAERPVDEAAE